MKISVIMPVYNVARFLPACLESLRAQTFRDWSCLLVDDGSSDGSSEICRECAARDARFTVKRTENRGASAARNAGLAWAGGDAVYFCDSDDLLHPDLLAVLAAALETTAADFAYVGANEFPADGRPAFRTPSSPPEVVDDPFSLYVRQKCGLALWHCLFRREVLKGISFYGDIRRGEDRLFGYRFLKSSPRMALVDAELYGYRQRAGSLVHAAIGESTVGGYASVMRRLTATYADDSRLGALRKGEFVFLSKCIVRECGHDVVGRELLRCREIIGGLFRDGILRFRDFGPKWAWRMFRFARRPRTQSA